MDLKNIKSPLEPIDIVDSCTNAFSFVWINRAYVFKLMLIPFLLTFAAVSIIYVFDMEDMAIKQALIKIPAFFAEGWMITQILRTVLLNQTWPVQYIKDKQFDSTLFQERSRAIRASVIIFVLIQMTINGLLASLLYYYATIGQNGNTETIEHTISTTETMAMFILTGLIVWAFRLTFLHIPTAANCSVKFFMKMMGYKFWPSIRLMGIFLLCLVPVQFFLIMIHSLFQMIIDPLLGEQAAQYLFTLLNVFAAMLISLIINIAVAISYKNIILMGRQTAPL